MKKSRRVTIMLDEAILKKLRIIQAAKIKNSEKSVSLSQIINETLENETKKIF